jgi:integrase
MASAYYDKAKGQWIASLRGPHQRGKLRKLIRIPNSSSWGKPAADSYAEECARYARLVESAPTRGDVDHAEHLGVLTSDQAAALRRGLVLVSPEPGSRDPLAPWTILDAAEAHPSTQHDKARAPAEYRKHRRYLLAFCDWAGIEMLAALTLDHAVRWVAHLRAAGAAWDTRRQNLLYLRRAARMAAAAAGMPDVLGELKLDRREEPPPIEVWTLAELGAACAALAARPPDRDTRRGLAVLALGGCLGLRPTELLRLRVEHLTGDILRVGVDARKNHASRRDLPVPASLMPWLDAIATDPKTRQRRHPREPLLPGRNRRAPLTPHAFDAWWALQIAPLLPRPGPPKLLRKSFATWAIESGIEARHVESYLGHTSGLVAAVTARHYLAAARVVQLRPVAAQMDTLIRAALPTKRLRRRSTQPRKSSKGN